MTPAERQDAVYRFGLTTVTQAEVARDLATAQPAHHDRIERGLALLHTREIMRMQSGVYWVQGAPSRDHRRPVAWYHVDPPGRSCTCPDYARHIGEPCKHVWAVEIRQLAASRALREERLAALIALAGCPDQATIDQLRRPA